MVSYFCGWHKLVNDFIYKLVLLNLVICSCLSLSRSVSMASAADIDDQVLVNNNNPLNQLMSSQQDMVQIAGYGEEKLSTVLITGSVHCEEACNNLHAQTHHHHPDHQLHLHAWPLSGALVSVNCHVSGRKRKSSFAQGFTDEYGDFIIDLPSNLHAIPNLHKTCSVRVVRIPKNTQCRPAYVRRHKGLKLSSVGNGIRTYNAGNIRFQHLTSKPSEACIKMLSS
ncbi:unnamed protein product [Prunus brigantina]